ncbi:MAG: hypothetical protein KBB88_01220 [Candidatus Pacebacteria bacterium]|nr:hypothetical protein [Candidatus Paceibacterota bacterium]
MNEKKYFIVGVLGIVVVLSSVVIYNSSHNQSPASKEAGDVTTDSLLGCYAFQSNKDIYTLEIRHEHTVEDRTDISGVLSYSNFQKDSSSGSFNGTYSNEVVVGNYSFESEGMHSVRQIAFKKVGDAFIPGYGPSSSIHGVDTFTDTKNIQYEPEQVFVKTTICNQLRTFTEQDRIFSFTYNPFFSVFEDEKTLSKNWKLNAEENGVLLARLDIPQSYFSDTNFSGAMLTIGQSSAEKEIRECLTTSHLGPDTSVDATIDNFPAKKYHWTDAGAGNFYETTSYHTIVDGDCFVLEYTIHSTNIGNYTSEQNIQEFNKEKITKELEEIIKNISFHIQSD